MHLVFKMKRGHIFAIPFILHVFIFHLVSLSIADIDTSIEINAQATANNNKEQCKRLMIYMPDNYSDVSILLLLNIAVSLYLGIWRLTLGICFLCI